MADNNKKIKRISIEKWRKWQYFQLDYAPNKSDSFMYLACNHSL